MSRMLPVLLVLSLLFTSVFWIASNQKRQIVTQHISVGTPIATLSNVQDLVPAGYELVSFISEEKQQEFNKAEQVVEAGYDYAAVMVTSKGKMVIDLFEDVPNTINNFAFLALNHFYEGIIFHRVLEGFMAQTGDPTGTGTGGPGYKFADEFTQGRLHTEKGTLSMANSGPNTNGSQFFMTFAPTEWLDSRHSVFGRVTEGLEVLDSIQLVDPDRPTAALLTSLTLAEVKEKGIALAGDETTKLRDYITSSLGAMPAFGKSFNVDGYKAVYGRVGNNDAIGFWPKSDYIEAVYIVRKAAN